MNNDITHTNSQPHSNKSTAIDSPRAYFNVKEVNIYDAIEDINYTLGTKESGETTFDIFDAVKGEVDEFKSDLSASMDINWDQYRFTGDIEKLMKRDAEIDKVSHEYEKKPLADSKKAQENNIKNQVNMGRSGASSIAIGKIINKFMTKPSKKLNNNLVAKCNLNAAVSATKATETALNNFRNNKNPLKSKDLLSQLNDRMSEMKVSTINLNKSCKRHLNPELKNKIQGFCEALKSDKNPASLASKVVPRDGPMIKMGDSIRRTSKMIAEAIKDMMANFLPKNKPLARMKL